MEAARRPLTLRTRRLAIGERFNLPYFDGVLLAAAIGLIAFSVFTLATATRDDIPGQPLYFMLRQSIYGVIGIALMFAVARIDYSRFREVMHDAFNVGDDVVFNLDGTDITVLDVSKSDFDASDFIL